MTLFRYVLDHSMGFHGVFRNVNGVSVASVSSSIKGALLVELEDLRSFKRSRGVLGGFMGVSESLRVFRGFSTVVLELFKSVRNVPSTPSNLPKMSFNPKKMNPL